MFNEYLFTLKIGLIFLLVSSFLSIVSFILVFQDYDAEKLSIYECGFNPFSDARNKFDAKFYLLALSFLIFDFELIFSLPWIVKIKTCTVLGNLMMIFFSVILAVGFYYEREKGVFNSD